MRMAVATLGRLLGCTRGMAALEFVFLAPALLLLVFAIIIYSIYFSALIGVRQAASEGARAAVAGLSASERASLAQTRAAAVMQNYAAILGGKGSPVISTSVDGTGLFTVQVRYDMSQSPIMRYGNMVPLPSSNLVASVTVSNGGY